MQILTEILELETSKRVQIIDITRNIDAALAESGLRKGLVNIYSKHSTSAIFINENESGLLEDYQNLIKSLIPTGNNYKHDRIDNNADSHLRSFIIGNNETIPFDGSGDLAECFLPGYGWTPESENNYNHHGRIKLNKN